MQESRRPVGGSKNNRLMNNRLQQLRTAIIHNTKTFLMFYKEKNKIKRYITDNFENIYNSLVKSVKNRSVRIYFVF